ncbi:MAG: hypothetical protein ACK40K_04965 [Raineya sp.]
MKKSLIFIFAFVFVSLALQAQSIGEKWKELKEFHSVMSQTFHPSEEGNLEPIKTRSGEMAQKAKVLAKSAIPAEFATPKIKDAVKRLNKGSQQLDKLVKSGKASDEQIKTSLAALHDVFHEIVGLCKNENH